MTSIRLAPTLLLAAGCATTSPGYLARVNDEVVTGEDLRAEFARSHHMLEKILGDEGEVRRFVDRLVDRRLFVQEGYRIGLHETPEVREAVERYRGQKMVERFLELELDGKVRVTDEDVRRVWETLPQPVEARQILVATQAEAEQLRARIAGGANFETLARERSRAPTAKHGGLVVIAWGGEPVYEREVLGLEDGALSPVLRTGEGWEIVRVEKRRDARRPELEKIGPKIRRVLEKRARAELEETLYAGLWAKYQARVLDCAPTPAALREAAARKEGVPCATWTGGAVTAEALAGRVRAEATDAAGDRWPELRKLLVEDLLNRELVRAEAEAQGYALRPEIVRKVKARQDDAVEGALFRDYVTRGIAPTDEEARRYYDANPAEFTLDVQLDLAQIVVDTEELAKEVDAKVRTRQPFAELAARYSKDQGSAEKGGRVGLVERSRLKDEFAPVAALQEGEVSAPIKAKDGYHLVKLLGTQPARLRPFEEVREQARNAVLEAQRKAAYERWVKPLREAARIEISAAGIKAFGREQAEALRKEREAVAAEVKARKVREEAEPARGAAGAGATPDASGPPESPGAAPAAIPTATPAAPPAP